MLNIQKIKFKNLLSSGNIFTELDFDTTKTTLLRGANGNGKSLVITALVFGLYGKSNRGTTKKQLVNSTNKKDCLVEVYFTTGSKNYKVVRGIAPNKFEIWIDGKLQEELSAVKDQQKYLEQNILKISFKTFMQVVVLGSNNFIPFMQLSASDRRDLVEELLDIKIFSAMNFILKDKLKTFERKLKEISSEKVSIIDKIEMQKHFMDTIRENGEELISKKELKIHELLEENEKYEVTIQEITQNIIVKQTELEKIKYTPKLLNKLLSIEGKLQGKKNNFEDELNFFSVNTSCPTCKSILTEKFRDEKIKELNENYEKLISGFEELNREIEDEKIKCETVTSITKEITDFNHEISSNQKQIMQSIRQIKELQEEINDTKNKINNQENEVKILKKLTLEQRKLNRLEIQCREAIQYFEFANVLMKDGGIKSKIIEKYLPVINQQINKYLQLMDLYINFSLDNEFKESVNTPIHEDFSYGSFSEGEKQKLNLAILFCWRDIAKMKNSVNCNLLFLDETFDSSLDGEGAESLLKIINYVLTDVNVFVISHRIDDLTDKFERILEVKKINGFSKIFS